MPFIRELKKSIQLNIFFKTFKRKLIIDFYRGVYDRLWFGERLNFKKLKYVAIKMKKKIEKRHDNLLPKIQKYLYQYSKNIRLYLNPISPESQSHFMLISYGSRNYKKPFGRLVLLNCHWLRGVWTNAGFIRCHFGVVWSALIGGVLG